MKLWVFVVNRQAEQSVPHASWWLLVMVIADYSEMKWKSSQEPSLFTLEQRGQITHTHTEKNENNAPKLCRIEFSPQIFSSCVNEAWIRIYDPSSILLLCVCVCLCVCNLSWLISALGHWATMTDNKHLMKFLDQFLCVILLSSLSLFQHSQNQPVYVACTSTSTHPHTHTHARTPTHPHTHTHTLLVLHALFGIMAITILFLRARSDNIWLQGWSWGAYW